MAKSENTGKNSISETKEKKEDVKTVTAKKQEEKTKPSIKSEEKKQLEGISLQDLVHLKDCALTLSNFYSQEYRLLEPYLDQESSEKKKIFMAKNQKYNEKLLMILAEMEKRIDKICQ